MRELKQKLKGPEELPSNRGMVFLNPGFLLVETGLAVVQVGLDI